MSGPPSPTAGVGSCSSATTLSLTGAPSPVRPAYSFGPQTGVTRSSASGGARPPFVTTDTCLVLGPELTGEPCESHNAGWFRPPPARVVRCDDGPTSEAGGPMGAQDRASAWTISRARWSLPRRTRRELVLAAVRGRRPPTDVPTWRTALDWAELYPAQAIPQVLMAGCLLYLAGRGIYE